MATYFFFRAACLFFRQPHRELSSSPQNQSLLSTASFRYLLVLVRIEPLVLK
jgi:hypothetical protein